MTHIINLDSINQFEQLMSYFVCTLNYLNILF